MSKTSDVRYGRRGGGWLSARHDAEACDVCRNATARFGARHRTTGEQWQVCARCEAQGQKFSAPVTYTPIEVAA